MALVGFTSVDEEKREGKTGGGAREKERRRREARVSEGARWGLKGWEEEWLRSVVEALGDVGHGRSTHLACFLSRDDKDGRNWW